MFVDGAAAFPSRSARSSSIETGTKLYISNLEYGVSNEDIKVVILFLLFFVFFLCQSFSLIHFSFY